jgi:CNT family concentrative nucleoside transporter
MATWADPAHAGRARGPRAAAVAVAALAGACAWAFGDLLGERGRAAAGALCLVAVVAACSPDLRRVNWRTVGWGAALQIALALLVLKVEVAGMRPGYALFSALAGAGARFLQFTDAGSTFVFGPLADEGQMSGAFGPGNGLVFAFRALPPIIFVSAFFTVLYHYGVLQRLVQWMARAMMVLMRTSGAETLAGAANVFIGQTEAPLIVKPFIPRMTRSELLAMMSVGMATSAGA